MKKSIFILFLALFLTGLNQALAQDPYLAPTPLGDCIDLDDPLNVVAGQPYTYTVDVPTPPGDHIYRWFVTQSTSFIENGGIIATIEPDDGTSPVLASGSAHYDTPTSESSGGTSIQLTWYSFILDPAEYVFVGIYVEEENGCSDNFKVYRIRPLHAFTLDLANVDNTGTDPALALDNFSQCVSDVESAVFDPAFGTDGGIVYDYGKDSLYYVVAAANFSTGYQLQAIFNGLQAATPAGTQAESATIAWAYTMAGVETAATQAIINGTTVTLGIVEAQTPPVGSAGEMIYIKVVINHNQSEKITSTNYTLAIDGILTDSGGTVLASTYGDLHYADCSIDLFVNDIITQVITLRPDVQPVTPAPFLPNAP